MHCITVIKSKTPTKVCKSYSLDPTGKLEKRAAANISVGQAKRVEVEEASYFVDLLNRVTEMQDIALCPGDWQRSQAGKQFKVLTEKALCELVGGKISEVQGGVIDHRGELISARLARGINYSSWLLLDADNPPGIPSEWAEMGIAERLELWEPFLPGVGRCERIELRSSSARVVKNGEAPGMRSHAWIRVSDPNKIPILKAHIQVQIVLHSASFAFERRSRDDPHKVLASEHRSVFDLAVFDKGRLVFCAKPEVDIEGYGVVDADVTLVNEGEGSLDLTLINLPSAAELSQHSIRTKQNLEFTHSGTGVQTVETGLLTPETEIEVKGDVRSLSEWVSRMSAGDKIRCEAPFRESQSEAAFIGLQKNGQPFIFDVGNTTKYVIAKRTAAEIIGDASALTNPETAGITRLVTEISELKPIDCDKALKALKASTGLSMGSLKQQLANVTSPNGYGMGGKPDQLGLARQTLMHIGAGKVIYTEQFFWLWNNTGVWKRADDRSVKQSAIVVMEQAKLPVSARSVSGTTELAKTEAFKEGHKFNLGDPETINCLNGEVYLDGGEWNLGQHKIENYRTAQIPVHYDPNSEAPRFVNFLDEIYADDLDKEQKITATLELLGYSLMSHTKHEKFALLIGSGANGKSVLLGLLEALCGPENISGVQPSKFDNPFQRGHLQYKLVNIVTELKQGVVIADAELKAITSGEPATVEHKNKDPFVMRPYSTCWFGTNHLPHTRDFSDAFFRRAVVLTFNNVFRGSRRDPNLSDKLKAELPGVLRLCLDAYAMALVSGFTDPPSSEAAKKEWRFEADQVRQYVDEACLVGASLRVQSSRVYANYETWTQDNGIRHRLGLKNFVQRLAGLGYSRNRQNDASYIIGLKIK
jgi:putative DNA primase/helicase